MSTLRPMVPMDLLHLGACNLDPLTETYNTGFYLEYLAKWPQLCHVIEGRDSTIEGYILGKVEASPHGSPTKEPYSPNTNKNMDYLPWHAHITALTVAPSCRRRGHARKLCQLLERQGEREDCWFVDLFVRKENVNAIEMYKQMGYSVFRRVVDYYNDNEDALDMRKPLPRDKNRQTIRENGENIEVEPYRVWGPSGKPSTTGEASTPNKLTKKDRRRRAKDVVVEADGQVPKIDAPPHYDEESAAAPKQVVAANQPPEYEVIVSERVLIPNSETETRHEGAGRSTAIPRPGLLLTEPLLTLCNKIEARLNGLDGTASETEAHLDYTDRSTMTQGNGPSLKLDGGAEARLDNVYSSRRSSIIRGIETLLTPDSEFETRLDGLFGSDDIGRESRTRLEGSGHSTIMQGAKPAIIPDNETQRAFENPNGTAVDSAARLQDTGRATTVQGQSPLSGFMDVLVGMGEKLLALFSLERVKRVASLPPYFENLFRCVIELQTWVGDGEPIDEILRRVAANISVYNTVIWTVQAKTMLVGERLPMDISHDARIWLERTGYHYLVNYQRTMWQLAASGIGAPDGTRDGVRQTALPRGMGVDEWLRLTGYREGSGEGSEVPDGST